MKVLEVRHLEMVAAICETRSVARAAERLHLSQPALSHALRALEDRLGVRLFERARRMTPTPAGVELQQMGEQIVALVRRAEERLHRHKAGSAGTIRLATECYTCYHWLPTVLQRLRSTHPHASVRIVGDATSRAVNALLNGELDLALVHFKPTHRRLTAEKLFTDEQVLIMSPECPLTKKAFVVPGDLRGERLFAHHEPEHTSFWKQVLEPAGVRPVEATKLHLTEAIVESVKAGLGVAVLARWAVANELAAGELVAKRIGRSGLRRSWYAAMRRGHVDPATSALVAILRTDAVKAVRRVPQHARAVAAAAGGARAGALAASRPSRRASRPGSPSS